MRHFSVNGWLAARRCGLVVAFAAIVLGILSSARTAPRDPPIPPGFESIDRPRPAPALEWSGGPAYRVEDLLTKLRQGKDEGAVDSRVSFNGHLMKPTQPRGQVRTPRPQFSPPAIPVVRGISVDVVTTRVTRPVEIGRNATATSSFGNP